MQQRYYLADTHFGHGDAILRFRPQFSTWQEHDQYIVDQINAVVNPTDSLYLLGDIVIRTPGYAALDAINCRNIYLVQGNHDGERCVLPTRYKEVSSAKPCRIDKVSGVITHIPVHPQCLDRWVFNIHGHLHDEVIDDPRYVCVSCEQTDFRPVNLDWIRNKLKGVLNAASPD